MSETATATDRKWQDYVNERHEKKGPGNGNYKHGRYTAEVIASRRWLRQFTRGVRALTKSLRQP